MVRLYQWLVYLTVPINALKIDPYNQTTQHKIEKVRETPNGDQYLHITLEGIRIYYMISSKNEEVILERAEHHNR